jgi:hypothetical protein
MNECLLVPIHACKSAGECEVVRMILASEGIATFVSQQHLSALMGRFDVEVLVDANDAERARSCIAAHRSQSINDFEFEDAKSPPRSADEQRENYADRGFPLLRWLRIALLHRRRRRQWWQRFIDLDIRSR